jgi:hypothetical protein
MAEQRTFNPLVQGSTPWRRTSTFTISKHGACRFFPGWLPEEALESSRSVRQRNLRHKHLGGTMLPTRLAIESVTCSRDSRRTGDTHKKLHYRPVQSACPICDHSITIM